MFTTRRYTKIIFALYCIVLFWTVFFKLSFSLHDIAALFGNRSINLIPFYYASHSDSHLSETFLNCLVFAPFSLLLSMLGANFKKAVLTTLCVSAVFELSQLIFALGACDLTDLITNTLGGILGAVFYFALTKLVKNKQKLHKILLIMGTIAAAAFAVLTALLILSN